MFFSFGYSGCSLEEFYEILKKFNIKVVADVRKNPTSKREEFCKEKLEKSLKERRIEYFWFEELGGFKQSYKEFSLSKTFDENVKKLEEIGKDKNLMILCMEKDWRKCHRKFIAQRIASDGFEVFHITKTKLIKHDPSSEEIKRSMQKRIFCDIAKNKKLSS